MYCSLITLYMTKSTPACLSMSALPSKRSSPLGEGKDMSDHLLGGGEGSGGEGGAAGSHPPVDSECRWTTTSSTTNAVYSCASCIPCRLLSMVIVELKYQPEIDNHTYGSTPLAAKIHSFPM